MGSGNGLGRGRFIKHIEKKEQIMVKSATFNKVRYEIDVCGPIDGCCDYPHGGKPTIRICADLKFRKGLETAIHESLHASCWAKSEEKVTQTAKDVARFLWRLGFRLKD